MKGFISEVTLVLCTRCKVKHESLVLSNQWIKPNFRDDDDDDDDYDDNDDNYCYYYNICVTILNLNL